MQGLGGGCEQRVLDKWLDKEYSEQVMAVLFCLDAASVYSYSDK